MRKKRPLSVNLDRPFEKIPKNATFWSFLRQKLGNFKYNAIEKPSNFHRTMAINIADMVVYNIHKGAPLASSTMPWNWLFFVP